jgi:hypothetical protein
MPLEVTGQRLGVDGVDREAGGREGCDEQVLVGLDRDRGLLGVAAVLGDQLEQRREPRKVGGHPPADDDLAVLIDQSDVVVGLGPVDAARERCSWHLRPSRRW